MPTETVSTAQARIANLIPVTSASLTGTAVWVLTHPAELPPAFRKAQETRTAVYKRTGHRSSPSYAARYIVTSYGIPIAWVTLDGRTHTAWDTLHLDPAYAALPDRRKAAVIRHLTVVREAWPSVFRTDRDGEVTGLPA